MAQDPNSLIWIDMEMSGLNPEVDRVLEIAVVVTDSELNTVAEAPVLVVHQADALLNAMDEWNRSVHSKSGLIARVRTSALSEAGAEEQMVRFLERFVPPATSPMCGNSVHQDRRFLVRHMPRLEAYFHYRNLDVSTLKELVKRWKPEIASGLTKQCKHEALSDIYDSITEMRYYREHFIKI